MFLLDDILLAPVSGFKFILGQIQKMADQELNDDTVIKEQLLELQMRLELEEISDEEYQEREAELFARLRALKTRQLELLHQVHSAKSPVLLSKSVAMTRVALGTRRKRVGVTSSRRTSLANRQRNLTFLQLLSFRHTWPRHVTSSSAEKAASGKQQPHRRLLCFCCSTQTLRKRFFSSQPTRPIRYQTA
jgi:hypothetical protein